MSTTVYKLTNPDLTTRGGYRWTPGEWRKADGAGDLCGPGWLHWYHTPLLAELLNPIHADFHDSLLWEAEADGEVRDDLGLKGGSTRLRIIRQIELPRVTTRERICCAIAWARAVLPVGRILVWDRWAEAYLRGDQVATPALVRSRGSAEWAAEWAARAAAWKDAAWAAAEAAAAAKMADAPLDLTAIAQAAIDAERARVAAAGGAS